MIFKKLPSINWNEIPSTASIVDVREPYEFKSGHAPSAKNVPLSKVMQFTSTKPVYVTCASGMRSRKAVKMMIKNGVDAFNIKGGMSRYDS